MKILIFIVLIINILSAENINYALEDNQAFTLNKDNLQFKASYLIVNEDIDIFNVRKSELGTSSSSLGDLDGVELGVRYGVSDKLNIFFDYSHKKIDYLDKSLKNDDIDFFGRYQLFDDLSLFFDSLSIDLGYKTNFSNSLSIFSENRINFMLDKIYSDKEISIENKNINVGDLTYALFDKDSNKISPVINIDNLEENSFYLKFLFGKKFKSSLLNLYFGYKRSSISNSISINPYNTLLERFFSIEESINLDRNENIFSIGINQSIELLGFIAEAGYEFSKISRDNDLNVLDIDHKFSFNISKPFTKDFLFFVGGELFLRNFNSEIPYLLNRYTKDNFYKKYGYVKTGLIFTFDSSKLF